jgi:hypothetical protein
MKPMFNIYEACNTEGKECADEFTKLIRPFLEKWAKKGFKVKDIESITSSCLQVQCAYMVLRQAMDRRKRERAKVGKRGVNRKKTQAEVAERVDAQVPKTCEQQARAGSTPAFGKMDKGV